jgi:hypothetical protein
MMAVAGARAETLELGVGSPPVSVAGPSSSSVSFTDPAGTFLGQGSDFSGGFVLGSTTHAISANIPFTTIDIWVTETGINIGPLPQKLKFVSSFTENTLPMGASVTETTWFDISGKAFGTGTELGTHTFTSIGTDTSAPFIINDHTVTPYSITEEYVVTIGASSPTSPIALSSIDITTTTEGHIPFVPEPSTWTMMALGFAGLGYAAYGRRRKFRAQASIV